MRSTVVPVVPPAETSWAGPGSSDKWSDIGPWGPLLNGQKNQWKAVVITLLIGLITQFITQFRPTL